MTLSHTGDISKKASSSSEPLSLSSAIQTLPTSATLAIHEMVAIRRARGQETIHLGFGEAAFPLHPLLKTALTEAAGQTGYSPVVGISPLREAIAGYLTRKRGIALDSDQIIVGPGSKPLLYVLLMILDGDVLLPVPSWVSYAPMVRLLGRRVIDVQTDGEDHHCLSPQALSQALTQARKEGANPRILIVNTPSNPTGSMFDRADVEAVALWAREEGITLISDEIYAELAHSWRPHVSPALFYPEGTIVTGGLSKTFSMGGWRIGYAALPSQLAGQKAFAAIRAVASEIWSTAASPLQYAAITAFSGNVDLDGYVENSARVHGYVTHQLYQTLVQTGVLCSRPAGGFYLYPDFSSLRAELLQQGVRTGDELARYLLERWDIAALPGSVFGEESLALRLRFSTSLLVGLKDIVSSDEHDAALWRLLAQAQNLPEIAEAQSSTPLLPLLERAQARLKEMVTSIKAS